MKSKQSVKYICTTLSIIMFAWITTNSQENTPNVVSDTLAPLVKQAGIDIKQLKKVKVSGYIQGQFQYAESPGIETTSADNFPSGIDKRFSIRRGRIKTAYTGKLSEAAVQLDFTVEKGVSLKEAYYKFTEPWLKTVSLQGGLFNRPFGYEIGFSGTAMEAPERARVIQTLIPGETDLGACLVINPPKDNPLNAFRIDAGFFNGTNNKVDFDNVKDFMGRLSYKATLLDKFLDLGAGVSYYNGGCWNFSPNYYEWGDTSFIKVASDSLKVLKREYIGADVQVAINSSIGQTVLRGELVWGTQPSASDKSKTPVEAYMKSSYIREFSGGYVYFVQNILKTKHKLVLKYEWYDPNTGADKDIIGATSTSKTSKGDIAYTTLGLGWNYDWDENVKITAFYDMTTNETTKLAAYSKDLKDNVLTIRIQYKF